MHIELLFEKLASDLQPLSRNNKVIGYFRLSSLFVQVLHHSLGHLFTCRGFEEEPQHVEERCGITRDFSKGVHERLHREGVLGVVGAVLETNAERRIYQIGGLFLSPAGLYLRTDELLRVSASKYNEGLFGAQGILAQLIFSVSKA